MVRKGLTYKIPEGSDLTDGDYSVCLRSLVASNSIPNVSPEKGDKLKYSVNGGTSWKIVTFPKGFYEIVTLNEYLEQALNTAGDRDKINIALTQLSITYV